MRSLCLFLAAAGLLFGFAVSEQELANHKQWMDDAQDLKEEIREALNASAHAQAVDSTRKLIALCEREVRFWSSEDVPEARELAESTLAAARSLELAARAKDLPRARKAFSEVETGCRTCHDLHFEKQLRRKGGS